MWLPLACPPLGTLPTTQAFALTGNPTKETPWFSGQHAIHGATAVRADVTDSCWHLSLLRSMGPLKALWLGVKRGRQGGFLSRIQSYFEQKEKLEWVFKPGCRLGSPEEPLKFSVPGPISDSLKLDYWG